MDATEPEAFERQVAELKRMGLNERSLEAIAKAGAEDGMPIAGGIVAGGAETVRLLNALQEKIEQAARQMVTVHVRPPVVPTAQIVAETRRQWLGMQRNLRLRPWT